MAKPNDEFEGEYFSPNYKKVMKNRLTPEELKALELELKPFYKTKLITWPPNSTPREESMLDVNAFLEHKGAMKNGMVVITNYKENKWSEDGKRLIKQKDCDPILYEQLLEDLEQLSRKRGAREYAIKMQTYA